MLRRGPHVEVGTTYVDAGSARVDPGASRVAARLACVEVELRRICL